MDRIDVIKHLIKKHQYKSYLEIGVLGGEVFFSIDCAHKIAVDPEFKFNRNFRFRQRFKNSSNLFAKYYEQTSDDFFKDNAAKAFGSRKLDICFVDGMHEFRYALNDVLNALKYLSDNGAIIVHDCNPLEASAEVSFAEYKQRGFTGNWNGDVWKSIVYLKSLHPELDVEVLDTDHGIGIIRKNKSAAAMLPYKSFEEIDALSYDEFARNRQSFLNLKPASSLR